MELSSPDTAPLRRSVYHLLIAIAFAIACGRILSVQRVYEPAFHNDPQKSGDKRPAWPAVRPDSNAMFGSNDRARWATIRSLVHEHSYVIGKREPKAIALSAASAFDPGGTLQGATLAAAGYYYRTDVANSDVHSGIIFKPGFKEHGWATIDRVLDPDRQVFLSSKPPLLSTLLAGVYWILLNVFGLSLIDQPTIVVRIMLLLVNGLPFAGYLWLVAQTAERWGKSDWGRLFIVACAAFATTVNPFLITLNNHTLGTFAVMMAWWSVLRVWESRQASSASPRISAAFLGVQPSPPAPLPEGEARGLLAPHRNTVPAWGHFVSAGFFASFAVTCEMPALAFAAAAFVLLLWWSPKRTMLAFVPAALIPAAAYLGTNYLATGQWRPAQSEFGSPWYAYEGSHWMPPPEGYTKYGVDWAKLHESRAMYAFHVLIGHHGLFTLTPIWLLALAAMILGSVRLGSLWRQAFFRERGDFPWFVQPLGLALTVVVVGFYLVKSDNYGGFTNGLRWLMWLTPIWLTCLIPMADKLACCWRGRSTGLVLLALSIFSMSYQLWSPWRHPWIWDLMLELGWRGY